MYKFPSQYNGYDHTGRRVYNIDSGGDSAPPPPQNQTVTQTNLPEYARPYFENLLQRGQAESYRQYTPYEGERLAGFTPAQMEVQRQTMGMQTPGQFGVGTGMVGAGGLASLGAGQYQPGQFQTTGVQAPSLTPFQMGPAMGVSAQQVRAPMMQTAQTGFNPALERFQMTAPEQFGRQQAEQYMSPFMQNVVDVQKAAAIRDAQRTQLGANLAAVRQGTYGGARQLLAQTERERALGGQLGDIQARGTQAAFEQAQQQFERDRAAQMGAQQQNLQAALGVQQLGTQTGLQAALANLSAAQQANVQNQSALLQAQGMNQEQALRAALANQQAGLTVGQQNLQSFLETQRLGAQTSLEAQRANQQAMMEAQKLAEQSRQFGSELGLRGAAQAIEAGRGLAQIGQTEQAAELDRLKAQEAFGSLTQADRQRMLDLQYQDFMAQQQFPYTQMSYMADILRGIPGRSMYQYEAQPSGLQSMIGPGLLGLGMYREFMR